MVLSGVFLFALSAWWGYTQFGALDAREKLIDILALPAPKPLDVKPDSATPSATLIKPNDETVMTDRGPLRISEGATVRLVTIYFQPNSKEVEEKYELDLWQIAQLASETRDSVLVVRGHADPTLTLVKFVQAGFAKGVLKREGSAGHFTYQLDGQSFDLADTARVIACIERGVVDGVEPDVRRTLSGAREQSEQRAIIVRDSLLEIAQRNAQPLDPNRVHVLVAGIDEPAVEKPQNMEHLRANLRVDVRLIRFISSDTPP